VQAIGVLAFLTVLVFVIVRISGDPRHAILPPDATPAQFQETGRRLKLDRPVWVQYAYYVRQLGSGDLGQSFYWNQPVTDVIGARIGATLRLGVVAGLLTLGLSVPLAAVAALYRRGLMDIGIGYMALLGQSTPPFLLGLVLVEFFAVRWRVLPAAGDSGPRAYVLPAITLALFQVAAIMRLLRAAMIEELQSNYALMARIKGQSKTRTLLVHVLRNAAGPALAYAGVEFIRAFLVGSIIVEAVFAWPGIGQLTYQSVIQRDYPVVQSLVLLFGIMFVLASFAIDLLHARLDPRLRSV